MNRAPSVAARANRNAPVRAYSSPERVGLVRSVNRGLLLSSGRNGRAKDAQRARSDCDVRSVEGWPVPVLPVKIEEIGDGTLPQTVDQVAGCPAHNHGKACAFQRGFRAQ